MSGRPIPTDRRPALRLRACEDRDLGFLLHLYASTRAREIACLVDWTAAQKDDFVRMQFRAQDEHYRRHYPDASYAIIVADDEDVGRFYVARLPGELRMMDMTLLPERRNAGIGTRLIRDTQAEARAGGLAVGLHVEDDNPAKRLYERLGFRASGAVTFYTYMRWEPPGGAGATGDPESRDLT